MKKLFIIISLLFVLLSTSIQSQTMYFLNAEPVNGKIVYGSSYDAFYSYYDVDFIYCLVKSSTKFNAYKITYYLYLWNGYEYIWIDSFYLNIKPYYDYAFLTVDFQRIKSYEKRFYKIIATLDDDDYAYTFGEFSFEFR